MENTTPLKTNEFPLKINGWKMYFLLKWSLFGGHVNFKGVSGWWFQPIQKKKKKKTVVKLGIFPK